MATITDNTVTATSATEKIDEKIDENNDVKAVVGKFLENQSAFDYLIDIWNKNRNKSQCAVVALDNNVLLCVRVYKHEKYDSTESNVIYFRKGQIITKEDGKKQYIEYDGEENIDIPEHFSLVGQKLRSTWSDLENNILESYKVFPVLDKKYIISKFIADKIILMYKDKPIYSLLYNYESHYFVKSGIEFSDGVYPPYTHDFN